MSVNESGFLSPEIQGWIAKHRQECAEAFELSDALNRAGVRELFACKVSRGDDRQLLVALLFGRTLSHFQGALVLIERGAVISAKALLRVMLEATFLLGASMKDPTFIAIFAKDDRRRKADMIDALLGIPAEENAVPADELDKLREQSIALRADIKADSAPKVTAFDAAKRAGLLDFYRLFYVPYCSAVHSAARDLDGHIVEGAEGKIASLKWGPQSAEVDDLVDAAIQIFFAAAHFAMQVFQDAEIDAEFTRIWQLHTARISKKTEMSKGT